MIEDKIEIRDDDVDILDPLEYIGEDKADEKSPIQLMDEPIDLKDVDIEQSLDEIEDDEQNDKIEMLGDVQKEVLRCLGMLP